MICLRKFHFLIYKGCVGILERISHFNQRETTIGITCVLFWTTYPFQNGTCSYRRELFPLKETNSFLSILIPIPFEKRGKKETGKLLPLTVYSFTFKSLRKFPNSCHVAMECHFTFNSRLQGYTYMYLVNLVRDHNYFYY